MNQRDSEYKVMYDTYLKYENRYWKWAELRKQFLQDAENRKYYKKNGSRTRRKYAEMVVADYPDLVLSGWDIYKQVGGCKDIVFNFGLTEWVYDVYVMPSVKYGGDIYMYLRDNPDLIYRAIEDTYEWSIELGIRTTAKSVAIPKVIEFIATKCIRGVD